MDTLSDQLNDDGSFVQNSKASVLSFRGVIFKTANFKYDITPCCLEHLADSLLCGVNRETRVPFLWDVSRSVIRQSFDETERSTKGRCGPQGVWEQIKMESSYSGFTLVKNSAETVPFLLLRPRWTVKATGLEAFRGVARVSMGCEQQAHPLMTLNRNIPPAAGEVEVCLYCGYHQMWMVNRRNCKRPHSGDEFGVKGV